MGGFYGTVQIRTEDRGRVLSVAEKTAASFGIRLLIGPNLDGWVGVYPEHAGQDQAVGLAFARQLGGEVLHAVVHDDCVMAYWFWLDGELVDSFWSAPGYFNDLDRRGQERMTGDVQAFGDLLSDRAEAFIDILRRDHHPFVFEAQRLQKFTELLGIRNGVTSYEYLKSGERVGIEGWEEFDEVPSDAVAAERATLREKRLAIERQKLQLRQQGLLLAEVVENDLAPRAAAANGGLLVAWEGMGRADDRLDFFREPWGDSEPGEIETGGQVTSMAADAQGQYLAMALGSRVVVWDAFLWQPLVEMVEDSWATQCALSDDGRLLAYASDAGVYVHDIVSGQRLTALSAHGAKVLAFHPAGQWIISAGTAVWIARVDGRQPWRELYPGGQTAAAPELSEAVRKQMAQVDLDAMEKKWRDTIEAAVARLGAGGANPAAEQMIAAMRQQMEKQLEQMRQNFANLKAGRLPPPQRGNENVLCAGFTRDGSRLWCGTEQGLRIYDWDVVMQTPGGSGMPRPRVSADLAHAPIYAAVEVPGRNALLFGGYKGTVCHLDLADGGVRELFAGPDGGAVTGLTLSHDGTAVGVCWRPGLGEGANPQDERAIWQIWSYPALLK